MEKRLYKIYENPFHEIRKLNNFNISFYYKFFKYEYHFINPMYFAPRTNNVKYKKRVCKIYRMMKNELKRRELYFYL
ncbi:hypothetical protein JCM31447_31830 (plasmid) [Fluviispira sanaruensis]|uniref:Uncharacterized protein n=1 Tax=Fluviispira sanaruensis TaxID=2493639 RepID=A0A4P2VR91_FLUSA|nr:hypothetical protein JCM31447_31830 [Fluviispira sanaruensis]